MDTTRNFTALLIAVGLSTGCASSKPTLPQLAVAPVRRAPMTPSQVKQLMTKLAAESEIKGKAEEREWARQHPDKVAEVNAARKAGGKPPLGQ